MIYLVLDGVLRVCEVPTCATVATRFDFAEDTVSAQSKSLAKASKDLAKVSASAFTLDLENTVLDAVLELEEPCVLDGVFPGVKSVMLAVRSEARLESNCALELTMDRNSVCDAHTDSNSFGAIR
jgi:hypothetical protein